MIGCGGGGSSGSSSAGSTVVRNFQSFSQVNPNTEYEMSGISLDGSYTFDTATGTVISVGEPSLSKNSSLNFTMNDNYLVTDLSIKTPTTSVSFSERRGDISGYVPDYPFIVFGVSADGTREIYSVDPYFLGWNYQTFGIWLSGLDTGSGRGGSISAGAPTAVSGIPTSGTANYVGLSGGVYIDPTGNDYVALGVLNVEADFGTRSLDFETSNTRVISRYTDYDVANSGLNLSGTLTYSSGSNNFTGDVTSASGRLSGKADGQFYGPSAQELGGVFSTTSSGIESYQGSFGAQRE
jgi:hypothetical protein